MDIEKCNEHRTRLTLPWPLMCEVCGPGPCRFPSGENPVQVTAVIATEDIKAGDLVQIKFDEASGNYYARKA